MTQEGRTIRAHWDLVYDHSIGLIASHFFDELKENQRILGRCCPNCRRVLVPPRFFCDRCYVETKDWIEVGKEGVIEAFTIIYQHFKGLPEPPYALAYVLLKGADTAMAGMARGIDLSDPKKAISRLYIGAQVRVVFAKERRGSVLDFWFEPI